MYNGSILARTRDEARSLEIEREGPAAFFDSLFN